MYYLPMMYYLPKNEDTIPESAGCRSEGEDVESGRCG